MLATHVLADSHSQRRFLIVEGVVSENRIQVLADGPICGVEMRYELQPSADLSRRISINIDLLIPIPSLKNFLYLIQKLHLLFFPAQILRLRNSVLDL